MVSATGRERAAKAWSRSTDAVLKSLGVSVKKGLGAGEVRTRQRRFGPNRLRETRRRSAWAVLLDQFKSLMTLLLGMAMVLSFALGDLAEGFAILAVVFINAALGFITELRAVRSMEALQKLGRVSAKVRRGGDVREVPAKELVPGDIVIIEGGDIVTADLRLIEASKLQADESMLTGESFPVGKQTDPVAEDAPLGDRPNMLFKGTAVTRGSGEGVVVAIGSRTELGRISSLVEQAEGERTPLEKRLDQLGRNLLWLTLLVAALIAGAGISAGRDLFLMVETAVALAVAAVPEGLPVVATIALGRGMWRMARKNALVNRLSAVETLGATNTICTDKTGTLTENRMTATVVQWAQGVFEIGNHREGPPSQREGSEPAPFEEETVRILLQTAVLCNNASLGRENSGQEEKKAVGDPLEVALLVLGRKAGLERNRLLEELPEIREEPFESSVKMMATFHREDEGYRVAVKGAPETVLGASTQELTPQGKREMTSEGRDEWLQRNRQMAESGLRMIALATKTTGSEEAEPYEGLTFLGLVGLEDPPRKDVPRAIASCLEAGVNLIMVTGDQAETALSVALAVGLAKGSDADKPQVVEGKEIGDPEEMTPQESQRLLETHIFARVSPEQKLNLITLHQRNNAIVAMTGDGINDAPALRKADIGVAMGQRGTQVAREAADMVLKDDAFGTIVTAVEQGRIIFGNIRKFVLYLLSCNVSEIMAVGLASLANAPLPILPLQILFLNLVTDVFPALALGVGEGDPAVMKHPPRDPQEPILTRRHWLAIGGYGILITAVVLGSLALALAWLGMDRKRAVSVSFLTLALAQLWHVFNMRDFGSDLLRNDITRNPFVWAALALCIGLLLAAVFVPWLSEVLDVVNPGLKGWLLILCASAAPLLLGQLFRAVFSRPGPSSLAAQSRDA